MGNAIQHPERQGVRSVDRAIDVLEAVARAARPMSLAALAAALGAPRSTTWTIVRTLAARRMLEYEPAARTYRLGPLVTALQRRGRAGPALEALARPHLVRLMRATREAALLHVRDGHQALCVAKVDSPEAIRYAAEVGARRPLHCTAAGKILLALAPAGFADQYASQTRLRPCSASTITDPGRLAAELAQIRRQGFSTSAGEYAVDLMAVAAPVLGPAGEMLGAVNVAGPVFRMRRRQAELAALVVATAGAIARDVGRWAGAGDGPGGGGRRPPAPPDGAGPARRAGGRPRRLARRAAAGAAPCS